MRRGMLIDLLRDARANAAAERALAAPLLLMIMLGSTELGNYFMNEHSLVKAVRDGARFAARQGFTNYSGCTGPPRGTGGSDTQTVVLFGYLSGRRVLQPKILRATATLLTQ